MVTCEDDLTDDATLTSTVFPPLNDEVVVVIAIFVMSQTIGVDELVVFTCLLLSLPVILLSKNSFFLLWLNFLNFPRRFVPPVNFRSNSYRVDPNRIWHLNH